MSRIFSSLAITSILLMLTTFIYGLFGDDYNRLARIYREAQMGQLPAERVAQSTGRETIVAGPEEVTTSITDEFLQRLQQAQQHTRQHMMLGILTTIVTVLVQSVGITYFIGTGRWFKEVSQAYNLEPSTLERSNRIKRSSFPYAMLGIATILIVAALGAAADPGTLREGTQQWVAPHYWAGILGICAVAFALGMQANAIVVNQQLIDDVMQQVQRARTTRFVET